MDDCTIRVVEGGDSLPPEGVAFTTISVMKDAYWGPDVRELAVSFLDVGDPATIEMILSHMNAWDCGLTFRWSRSGGVVRVTTGAGGYWSYLGTQILRVPPGEPTMNLERMGLWTPESERRRVIRHETFHTMGGGHEHLREELVADIDPARAYAFYWQTQRWTRAIVDANVLRPLSSESILGTPVDGHSIMAYPIPPEITHSGRGIPGGDDINATDLAFAKSVYPAAGTPPPPPPTPPGPPGDDGPYVLTMGRASPKVLLRAGRGYVFKFRVRGARSFAATTAGGLSLRMSLHGPDESGGSPGATIRADDEQSGVGGNALIAATLRPGVYFLRVTGEDAAVAGAFRARVASI